MDIGGGYGLIEGTAGVGAAYQFTKDATSNLRQKDDCYSEAVAGFVGGMGLGVYSTCIIFPSTIMLTIIRAKPSIHARCWSCYLRRHDCIPLHQRLEGRNSRDR
jgi:hypothetical protein